MSVVSSVVRRVFRVTGSSVRRERRLHWDAMWSKPTDRVGWWRLDGVADEVRQAFEDGWLHSGMSILDVGCGSGENARWLGARGCEVLGVDLSEVAISKARAATDQANVSFGVVDVTIADALAGVRFDAIVDRGCLHGIPARLHASYAQNVSKWVGPGDVVLVAMHVSGGATPAARDDLIRSLFVPAFEQVDRRDTLMAVRRGQQPIAGVAYRLMRRPLPETPEYPVVGGGGFWPEA